MAEIKKYSGGCHCGKVRFEVNLDLESPAGVCNCSICSKTGTMLQFVPASEFHLLQGEEALSDYLFNKRQIHHLFCSTCGIRSFARGVGPDGAAMCAVNVRALDGVNLDEVPTTFFDGKSY